MDTFQPAFSSWLNAPAHQQWLAAEGLRLLAFAKASKLPEGFGNLDEKGRLPANAHAETMNTARMTHSFAMAHIQGLPGFAELVDHGIKALAVRCAMPCTVAGSPSPIIAMATPARRLTCTPSSRWPPVPRSSRNVPAPWPCSMTRSTSSTRISGAKRKAPCANPSIATGSVEEAYRGANSNMHATEAFLALADVTETTAGWSAPSASSSASSMARRRQ